jgi:hypothetical protein
MGRTLAAMLAVASCTGTASAQPLTAERDAFFESRIRPVLAGTCFACHGGKKTSGGLRVDSREALLKGGGRGPAVVPGDVSASLVLRALRHVSGDLRMPPENKLPDQTIADFETWVRQGAPWPALAWKQAPQAEKQHWAFQPVKKRPPPIDPSGWAQNPIDCFILAELRQHGLKPAPPADRRVLLRRLYFDLIGLPPDPEDVAAFLSDTSPAAVARVVDRLLASPHYGERWGRHWMDVVRYADTAGDNADYPIPEIYRYRDYIIDAFNRDQPYDQFVREQIAGDLLGAGGPPEKYAERVVATGFLALSRRYATAPYELWHLTLEDTIDTVGQAYLGLTLRCARCHDHKFDPVTMEDYYGLYGIFASTRFPYTGSEEFASMKKPRQLAELKRAGLPANLPAVYAVSEGKPADVPMQKRGDPDRPGREVPRSAIKFLGGDFHVPPGQSGRLQLVQWLTRPDHPLTARVLVNRLWQHHFGKGIVATPSNFGLRGAAPTHPELLDYLAAVFVENGWSIKKMHRLIVLSNTYQMASAGDAGNAARDGGNQWYWHFDRRRLDAEAIRDALLAVSGTLDSRRPGPQPFPPISQWKWTQHNPFKDAYPTNQRSVYLMTQRLQKHPFLALFDGPDTNMSAEKRTTSTVPLQALFWMNSPMMRQTAEAWARRLLAAKSETMGRIRLAFELAFARPATAAEVARGDEFLKRYQQELRKLGVAAAQAELEAWTSYARLLLSANEFLYID